MGYKVVLINLPIVHIKNDPFGDIPFMPTGILYLAGYLKANSVEVSIIDGFGASPKKIYKIDSKLNAVGLTENEIVTNLNDARLVGISVHSGMSHSFSLRLASKIRSKLPDAVLIAGGSHASVVYDEFLKGDFDYVCIGEGEHTLLSLIKYLRDGTGNLSDIPGLASAHRVNSSILEPDLDKLGFALFEALPLENYWNLGMSHAPIKGRYISITTSRGCPYNCRFCTTPGLLGRRWRSRSSRHVVDEIEEAIRKYSVESVVIQDEIFACQKGYAQDLARDILNRNFKIKLYLPSGLKVETLDDDTLVALRKAGVEYLCLAPESGSERMLKEMNKPMDFAKLYRMVSLCKKIGIKTGCFFIIGFIGENDQDRKITSQMIGRLTRMGVDEFSLFIWSPLPGAEAFKRESGWLRYEDLNWSPSWRSDYKLLAGFRRILYIKWLLTKLIYRPLDIIQSAWNIIIGNYNLKSEMALRRFLSSYIVKK